MSPGAPAIAGTAASGQARPGGVLESGKVAVLVRAGKPYLVLGTRLYGVGERVGQTRIERLSETEVWLREAGQLRKVSVFRGIDRRAVPPDMPPSQKNQLAAPVRSSLNKP